MSKRKRMEVTNVERLDCYFKVGKSRVLLDPAIGSGKAKVRLVLDSKWTTDPGVFKK